MLTMIAHNFLSARTVLANRIEIIRFFFFNFLVRCCHCHSVFLILYLGSWLGHLWSLQYLFKVCLLSQIWFFAGCARLFTQDVLLSVVKGQAFHYLRSISLISGLKQALHVNSKLYGITSWSRSEIILSSFQTRPPCIEMHRRHLLKDWIRQVQIETLGLANKWTATDC